MTTIANSIKSTSVSPSGIPIFVIGGIEFVHIPEGIFKMGSTEDNIVAHPNERPQLLVYLPEYWMSRYPITNAQYLEFCKKSGYPAYAAWERKERTNYPATYVTWNDAVAFCEWYNLANKEELENAGGLRLFLPSEAEWEKAARGDDGREWPWGNESDDKNFEISGDEDKETTPVGRYSPNEDSPYGCADMAGNVWEYTRTQFACPHTVEDDLNGDLFAEIAIRGGTFRGNSKYHRCAYRDREKRNVRFKGYGFRVCLLTLEMTKKYIKQMVRLE
ncbi:MAG: formylglycine-generating enzyme family protein [Anaerolineaceae bacterium]|nr:formylglycine-generating enzyme family protein [Anaerolineaceae bacterium]